MIKAYVTLTGGGEKAVIWKDFQKIPDIKPQYVSGSNNFLESLSLIEPVKGKRGFYTPTQVAQNISNALKWGKEDEARHLLQKVMMTMWFWDSAKQLLEMKGRVTEQNLLVTLGYDSSADPEQHKGSLRVLIDGLTYVGLIAKTDGEFTLAEPLTEVETKIPPEEETVEGEIEVPLKGPEAVSEKELLDTLMEHAITAKAWARIRTKIPGVWIVNPERDEKRRKKTPRLQVEVNPIDTSGSVMKRSGYYLRTIHELEALKQIVNNPELPRLLKTIERLFYSKEEEKYEEITW